MPPPPAVRTRRLQEVTITAKRLDLLGEAVSASEGVVADEARLTPSYRPGQLLETVPGLIATLHSRKGDATPDPLRGYTWTTARPWLRSSMACRSISRRARTVRAIRTSIS